MVDQDQAHGQNVVILISGNFIQEFMKIQKSFVWMVSNLFFKETEKPKQLSIDLDNAQQCSRQI